MNLKDEYNKVFIEDLGNKLSIKASSFDATSFYKSIINEYWEKRELKDRIRHVSKNMQLHLKLPYKNQIEILKNKGNINPIIFGEKDETDNIIFDENAQDEGGTEDDNILQSMINDI